MRRTSITTTVGETVHCSGTVFVPSLPGFAVAEGNYVFCSRFRRKAGSQPQQRIDFGLYRKESAPILSSNARVKQGTVSIDKTSEYVFNCGGQGLIKRPDDVTGTFPVYLVLDDSDEAVGVEICTGEPQDGGAPMKSKPLEKRNSIVLIAYPAENNSKCTLFEIPTIWLKKAIRDLDTSNGRAVRGLSAFLLAYNKEEAQNIYRSAKREGAIKQEVQLEESQSFYKS